MKIAMIGLGKMGANMTTRLLRAGHAVVAYDRSPDAVAEAAAGGAIPANSLDDLVQQLTPPRVVWVMVPSGARSGMPCCKLLSMTRGASVLNPQV